MTTTSSNAAISTTSTTTGTTVAPGAAAPLRITILNAGLRVPSSTRLLADQIGTAVRGSLDAAGVPEDGAQLHTVDLRDHAHAIADAMLTGFASGALKDDLDRVLASDALVVVTPTFQASYSGLFKSFIDLVETGTLRGMPVLLAATGGSERHSLMIDHSLRPLFAHLGAEPIATGIFAATSDFGGEGSAQLAARIDRGAAQLVQRIATAAAVPATDTALDATVGAMPAPSPRTAPAVPRRQVRDEFTDVVPFAQLLQQYTS